MEENLIEDNPIINIQKLRHKKLKFLIFIIIWFLLVVIIGIIIILYPLKNKLSSLKYDNDYTFSLLLKKYQIPVLSDKITIIKGLEYVAEVSSVCSSITEIKGEYWEFSPVLGKEDLYDGCQVKFKVSYSISSGDITLFKIAELRNLIFEKRTNLPENPISYKSAVLVSTVKRERGEENKGKVKKDTLEFSARDQSSDTEIYISPENNEFYEVDYSNSIFLFLTICFTIFNFLNLVFKFLVRECLKRGKGKLVNHILLSAQEKRYFLV